MQIEYNAGRLSNIYKEQTYYQDKPIVLLLKFVSEF